MCKKTHAKPAYQPQYASPKNCKLQERERRGYAPALDLFQVPGRDAPRQL